MTFYILTLFPKTIEQITRESILKRAISAKTISIKTIDIRNFAKDKHKTVDDKPYGGGQGMVLKADIVVNALESIKQKPYTILLSASGKKYNQGMAVKLSKKKRVAIICGHYEGIDVRVEKYVDEIISIGDYVLTGGEIAACAVIDSTSRLIPGVIKKASAQNDSFSQNGKWKMENGKSVLLEYPQYTRPENFREAKVPKVLLSGSHAKIEKWRQNESLKRTKKFRPDLLLRNPKH